MGRIRRGDYIFIGWIGDRPPRHVHIYDDNANFITRMNLETLDMSDGLPSQSSETSASNDSENTAFNGAELSESVLGRDWNSSEEDAAWSNL